MTAKAYTSASTAARGAKRFVAKTDLVTENDFQVTGDKESGFMVVFTCRTPEATAAVREAGFASEDHYTSEAPAKRPSGYIRENSIIEGAVATVWAIADDMKGERRKDVVAACRAAGVAYGTARTQYQKWKKARGL